MASQPRHLTTDIGPARHPVYFDAEWQPNRALSPRAFAGLTAAMVAVSTLAGAVFFQMGAWPVTGFFGLDVVLFYGAFKLNFASGAVRERIRLDACDLLVRRRTRRGEVFAWRFEPTWARIDEDADLRALSLRSHGRQLVLARFLGEDERREIAKRLQAALTAWSADPVRRNTELRDLGRV